MAKLTEAQGQPELAAAAAVFPAAQRACQANISRLAYDLEIGVDANQTTCAAYAFGQFPDPCQNPFLYGGFIRRMRCLVRGATGRGADRLRAVWGQFLHGWSDPELEQGAIIADADTRAQSSAAVWMNKKNRQGYPLYHVEFIY